MRISCDVERLKFVMRMSTWCALKVCEREFGLGFSLPSFLTQKSLNLI